MTTPNYTTLTASPPVQSYYITVAKSSKQIFISFSLFELGFCIILLALSKFERVPRTSAPVDFNLITMFDSTNESFPEPRIKGGLFCNDVRNFSRALFGMRLQVREASSIRETEV